MSLNRPTLTARAISRSSCTTTAKTCWRSFRYNVSDVAAPRVVAEARAVQQEKWANGEWDNRAMSAKESVLLVEPSRVSNLWF